MTFFAPCAYKKLLVREQRESLSARNSKKNAHQLFYGRMHYWHKVLVTEGCPPPPKKKKKLLRVSGLEALDSLYLNVRITDHSEYFWLVHQFPSTCT